MIAVSPPPETLADLWDQLGNVPLNRIRMFPYPGTATVEDVERLCNREPKLFCELVDGVLIEKPRSNVGSRLVARLAQLLFNHIDDHDTGIVTGAGAPHRILPEQVRYPSVAFIPFENIPPDADPSTAVPDWVPSLAVEVISESNTKAEMDRKLRDYFAAGVKLVWYVDPPTRSVRVFHSTNDCLTKTENDELDGEDVLPGLRISIKDWFDRALRVRPS